MSKASESDGPKFGPPLMKWFLAEYEKFSDGETSANAWFRLMGFTDTDYWRWVNGTNQPSLAKLVQLAEKMPPEYSLLDVLVAAEMLRPDQVGGYQPRVMPGPLTIKQALDLTDWNDADKKRLLRVIDAMEGGEPVNLEERPKRRPRRS